MSSTLESLAAQEPPRRKDWFHKDSDEHRLPEGMKRVAYDADKEIYTFKDREGKLWQGEPGNYYGKLWPKVESEGPRRMYSTSRKERPPTWASEKTTALPAIQPPQTFGEILKSNPEKQGFEQPTRTRSNTWATSLQASSEMLMKGLESKAAKRANSIVSKALQPR